MMADDELNATELRKRYHRGGTVPDSDLNASQLRGRYGIENAKCISSPVVSCTRQFFLNECHDHTCDSYDRDALSLHNLPFIQVI